MIWLLRSRGYVINMKRKAIISGMCTLEEIDNAEELWLYLKGHHHKISIASVYYNLKMMDRENLIIKTPNHGRRIGYRLARKKPIYQGVKPSPKKVKAYGADGNKAL
ncbi:MAG: transcriptional repressor [Proteus vulgaris]